MKTRDFFTAQHLQPLAKQFVRWWEKGGFSGPVVKVFAGGTRYWLFFLNAYEKQKPPRLMGLLFFPL
jgi:hypothetical protein